MENNLFSILITGDLVINQGYSHAILLDGMLTDAFNQSDLNIINLEAPITRSTSKIKKTGPHLLADKKSVSQVLGALNVNVVTLANNHVLDYDERGIEDTLAFCKERHIRTVGAGMNLKDASKVLYLNTNVGKIAIVNFAENEWTCATEKTAGANPMDIIDNVKQIQKANKNADFLIVIVHGGNEYNHYPSPRMVKQYRFYADNGADAVIGHHTHCVSGYENYGGAPIFYSLGNFLFTTEQEKLDSWYSGLVVKLNLQKNKKVNFEVIPIYQDRASFSLFLAQGKEREKIMNIVDDVNQAIGDSELLEREWQEFVNKVQGGFIKTISPLGAVKNRYLKAALYRSSLYKLVMNEKYVREHLNRIRCEAHYDVVKQILKDFSTKF